MSPVQETGHTSEPQKPVVIGKVEVPNQRVPDSGIALRCPPKPVRHTVLKKE